MTRKPASSHWAHSCWWGLVCRAPASGVQSSGVPRPAVPAAWGRPPPPTTSAGAGPCSLPSCTHPHPSVLATAPVPLASTLSPHLRPDGPAQPGGGGAPSPPGRPRAEASLNSPPADSLPPSLRDACAPSIIQFSLLKPWKPLSPRWPVPALISSVGAPPALSHCHAAPSGETFLWKQPPPRP